MMLSRGTRLKNRYVCDHALRKGGQGTVWLARDADLFDSLVAIKTLHEDTVIGREELFQRFQREARHLVVGVGGGLPYVRDFFAEDDTHYLVMEFIPGEDLDEQLKRLGRMLDEPIVRVGVEVAQILEHLHAQGIAHLDVKPANLKVMPDGHVKLVDFGIATPLGETIVTPRALADRTTQRAIPRAQLRA